MKAVPGATPNRTLTVVVALLALLVPALLTALLVAGAARAERPDSESGTLGPRQVLQNPVHSTSPSGKDLPGT